MTSRNGPPTPTFADSAIGAGGESGSLSATNGTRAKSKAAPRSRCRGHYSGASSAGSVRRIPEPPPSPRLRELSGRGNQMSPPPLPPRETPAVTSTDSQRTLTSAKRSARPPPPPGPPPTQRTRTVPRTAGGSPQGSTGTGGTSRRSTRN